ncbi:RNA-directed DNA polymerase from mobile element jockey-like [Brachionus plicatilis]|uniref:RNA-directed DNA polymerase from mobile element jockey-like n=1 Tax=Brachionus plicatilis TaxID=10195 RepID=A0A3M7RXV3_BRAPC|nr:RNA-directed DNA polymerase from mobile element jockey-like [Brachionus plicatilis]
MKDDITENVWCSIKNGQDNILLDCAYRPPNSSNLTNRSINVLLAEASKLVTLNRFTTVIICGDFNYPAIKWSKNGYPEIFPHDQESSFFVDNVIDCFLNQMVVEHTFHVSDGCTTNTLDLILTTCENRVTNIVNKPPLGGLNRGHTVLSWMFMTINNSAKVFDSRSFNFFRGDFNLFMNNLKSIDWESSLKTKMLIIAMSFS